MIVKLLAEHHFEFLSLKVGCTGSSESTHVKMPHCWKSHVMAHLWYVFAKILPGRGYIIQEDNATGDSPWKQENQIARPAVDWHQSTKYI